MKTYGHAALLGERLPEYVSENMVGVAERRADAEAIAREASDRDQAENGGTVGAGDWHTMPVTQRAYDRLFGLDFHIYPGVPFKIAVVDGVICMPSEEESEDEDEDA